MTTRQSVDLRTIKKEYQQHRVLITEGKYASSRIGIVDSILPCAGEGNVVWCNVILDEKCLGGERTIIPLNHLMLVS